MRKNRSPIELVTRSEYVLFFKLELVTPKQKKKSLTIQKVPSSEIEYFSNSSFKISNYKVKQ